MPCGHIVDRFQFPFSFVLRARRAPGVWQYLKMVFSFLCRRLSFVLPFPPWKVPSTCSMILSVLPAPAAPPGTSDEHISMAQFLKATGVDGAIVVTTPQEVSIIDVRKEINFCKKVGETRFLTPCRQRRVFVCHPLCTQEEGVQKLCKRK